MSGRWTYLKEFRTRNIGNDDAIMYMEQVVAANGEETLAPSGPSRAQEGEHHSVLPRHVGPLGFAC